MQLKDRLSQLGATIVYEHDFFHLVINKGWGAGGRYRTMEQRSGSQHVVRAILSTRGQHHGQSMHRITIATNCTTRISREQLTVCMTRITTATDAEVWTIKI